MKKFLVLIAINLTAVGLLIYVLDPGRRGAPPAPGAAAVLPPAAIPSPAEASHPTRLKQEVPVPEHLQNPAALALQPLALNLSAPPFERRNDGRVFKTDVIGTARSLNSADREPIEDLHTLQSIVGSYRTIFKENPVAAENRQVVEALTGKNPYRLVFVDPAHPAIGPTGELLDRWGTPYRFHPVSGTHMEFSSAGEDGHLGTGDDVHLVPPLLAGDGVPEGGHPGPRGE